MGCAQVGVCGLSYFTLPALAKLIGYTKHCNCYKVCKALQLFYFNLLAAIHHGYWSTAQFSVIKQTKDIYY